MKSGIYRIQSKVNNKCYIGSSVNWKVRISVHKKTLLRGTHHSKYMQNHVNKYGIDDLLFSLMESVDDHSLIEREQYYIDTLKPEFNICKIAGSCLGVKHDTSRTKHRKGENTPTAKLTEKDIFEIRELITIGVKFSLIMKKYNVSRDNLQGIKSGEYWAYLKLPAIKINRASEMTLEKLEEVQKLIVLGKTTASIARDIKMSINTVRKIRNNGYKNLQDTLKGWLS